MDLLLEARFSDIDRNADGLASLQDFLVWQQGLLSLSHRPALSKHQRLRRLIQDITQLQQADSRFAGWRRLAAEHQAASCQKTSGQLAAAVATLETALAGRCMDDFAVSSTATLQLWKAELESSRQRICRSVAARFVAEVAALKS